MTDTTTVSPLVESIARTLAYQAISLELEISLPGQDIPLVINLGYVQRENIIKSIVEEYWESFIPRAELAVADAEIRQEDSKEEEVIWQTF